jgi:hypothetical protein
MFAYSEQNAQNKHVSQPIVKYIVRGAITDYYAIFKMYPITPHTKHNRCHPICVFLPVRFVQKVFDTIVYRSIVQYLEEKTFHASTKGIYCLFFMSK